MRRPIDDVPVVPGGEEVRKDLLQHSARDDATQEVVRDDPLIVEPHLLLHLLERQERIVSSEVVVEPQHESLELGHDRVLVVAGIADHRALVGCARQVLRLRDRSA